MKSLAQFEAEAIAWINIVITVMAFVMFGIYTTKMFEGVQDFQIFLFDNPVGREVFWVLTKFFIFMAFWIPMSFLLKVAAYKRNGTHLKAFSTLQIILLFLVALHLLINPPISSMVLVGYTATFVYFIFSLWISETLIREVEDETVAKFRAMDNNNTNDESPLTLNDRLNDSVEFRKVIEDDNANEIFAIPMKKIQNHSQNIIV